jgi:hypothetical protein
MEIHTCDQGTEEWFRARAGIPTASEFGAIVATGRGGAESKTRRSYLLKLAGEILTGELTEAFRTTDTDRGHRLENEVRDLYAFVTDHEVSRAGFIVNEGKGCSPDGLIASDGMLEIKTKLPHLLIEVLLKDEFPPDHKAQCQGALWVAEREWIDIAVYWPRLPLFIRRAHRDEAYITQLASAVEAFNAELYETVLKVRSYPTKLSLAEQMTLSIAEHSR